MQHCELQKSTTKHGPRANQSGLDRTGAGSLRETRGPLVLFAIWAVLISLPLAYLTANHLVPIPAAQKPESPPVSAQTGQGWKAIHLLAADCGCSLSVARHLQSRGPLPGLTETIVIIGDAPEVHHAFRHTHFAVETHDASRVEKDYGVIGGPWMLLFRPDGRLAYSGGYAPVRARDGIAFQDIAIWTRALSGETIPPLPAFGCATGEQLRKTLDPLNLKYTR